MIGSVLMNRKGKAILTITSATVWQEEEITTVSSTTSNKNNSALPWALFNDYTSKAMPFVLTTTY